MSNILYVLIGKSSSGKDTLANNLRECGNLSMCISTTSRPARINEIDKVHYNFVSKNDFISKIQNNEMIEYRSYNTELNGKSDIWYYGTELKSLKNNLVLVLDIDGLIELKNKLINYKIISIYLDCSDDVRKERAIERGTFCEIEWNRRLIDDNEKFNIDKIRRHTTFIIDSSSNSNIVLSNVRSLLNI